MHKCVFIQRILEALYSQKIQDFEVSSELSDEPKKIIQPSSHNVLCLITDVIHVQKRSFGH